MGKNEFHKAGIAVQLAVKLALQQAWHHIWLEATGRELEAVFGRNGISKVESVGQPLDPNKHQAMMEVPSADAAPGTILVEMQAGYMIKDRLLRPAMVSVAKAPD